MAAVALRANVQRVSCPPAEAAGSPEVWIFPYLPPCGRITFGPWEVIQRSLLTKDVVVSEKTFADVNGLLDLYDVPRDVGAVVRFNRQKVGAPIDRSLMERLEQTATMGLLDATPEPDRDRRGFTGVGSATAENAILFGHRIDPNGWVAVEYGHITRVLSGGMRIGVSDFKIRRPAELFV